MKSTITLSSLLLIIAFILPSCGMNIVKRQHRGGYYISTNKGYKHSQNAEESKEDVAKTEKIRPEIITDQKSETASSIEVKNEETAVVLQTENTSSAEGNVIDVNAVENSAVTTYNTKTTSHKKTLGENKFINKAMERMPMTKKLHAKVKTAQESSARGDGLSLFWIVILVLLLLYVLGVTGHWFPGGLIHVLLIIALVLLILWLLRVL